MEYSEKNDSVTFTISEYQKIKKIEERCKKKIKRYIDRNIALSKKNKELREEIKKLQEAHNDKPMD